MVANKSMYDLDPSSLSDLIRAKVRLVDLMLSDSIDGLRDSDVEQQISCPFHGRDASPSMRVYPHTNSCYCFKCKESWDPISYTMRKKNMNFTQAVGHLVSVKRLDVSGVPRRSGRLKDSTSRYTANLSVGKRKPGVLNPKPPVSIEVRVEKALRAHREELGRDLYAKSVHLLGVARGTEDLDTKKKLIELVVGIIKKSKGQKNG